eukprot:CAMPEP_0176503152 /NCGR_PEP_ID=MMETSP0200_2-20121128/15207_1 /TAXON_ID=947934 /ORGANISM="Chaetoceros sp., Strain GSL56" /LENGTH=658 /DNA_ID=CAMNT_0017902417 /DNA_START=56 /DNA_END=2032 /DNA_ORIENTATION=-
MTHSELQRDIDMECPAYPGLITLLDAALYRTFEGQLTATVSSANATLSAFLQVKRQSNELLQACRTAIPRLTVSNQQPLQQQQQQQQNLLKNLYTMESFAVFCMGCSSEAISQITTDKLASSANLSTGGGGDNATETTDSSTSSSLLPLSSSPPSFPLGLFSSSSSSQIPVDFSKVIPQSSKRSWEEVALRLTAHQQHDIRKGDCWESTKLYCPDYVWGHESILQCQRLVRSMVKHDAVLCMTLVPVLDKHVLPECAGNTREVIMNVFENIMVLLKHDVPLRLQQFRKGIESDALISKRLYLVKNEYRAPFRAFLEAHLHFQMAPRIELVEEYIQIHEETDNVHKLELLKEKRRHVNQKVQACLSNGNFVKALAMEEKCEKLEISMATMLFPFCELARLLCDGNQIVGLVEVPGVLEGDDFLRMQELLRTLKNLLYKKNECGSSSTGIRPLLMDLQGISRDPSFINRNAVKEEEEESSSMSLMDQQRLSTLCCQLKHIGMLGTSNRFVIGKKDKESSHALIEACTLFNGDVFSKVYRDWYNLCKRQREIFNKVDGVENTLDEIMKQMRQAEIETSIAISSKQDLFLARERIHMLWNDRQQKFDVLEETLHDCCLREMDCRLNLLPINEYVVLSLPNIQSVAGIFDIGMELAGEIVSSC